MVLTVWIYCRIDMVSDLSHTKGLQQTLLIAALEMAQLKLRKVVALVLVDSSVITEGSG